MDWVATVTAVLVLAALFGLGFCFGTLYELRHEKRVIEGWGRTIDEWRDSSERLFAEWQLDIDIKHWEKMQIAINWHSACNPYYQHPLPVTTDELDLWEYLIAYRRTNRLAREVGVDAIQGRV
jgi:hypothetical protein